ncbi:MAG: pyridoxamine 5'-phosphate [Prolixibacteraceae bacterium]|nr:MAG: pyridoxamine 5'-phosphate [Prolixibacteraceae bacterium]
MKLHTIRTEYKYAELTENNIEKNPLKQFDYWLNDAISAKVNEPTAMSAVTVGVDGFPDSRIVLLKDYNENGFTFFTSYNSNKGKAIAKNPAVGLHFFWPELERQIRILGFAEKTSGKISDWYFSSRPVLSQIAAFVSDQSSKIPSRGFLQSQFENVKTEMGSKNLKRPENWGGYLIKPVKFEFWQGRESRLHDRILYENKNGSWIISRLAP